MIVWSTPNLSQGKSTFNSKKVGKKSPQKNRPIRFGMKYRIDSTYCWYSDWLNKNSKVVLMYFINGIPFTYDELEDIGILKEDARIIADCETKYNTEELYNYSCYLMQEEFHPLIFDLELENPEILFNDK